MHLRKHQHCQIISLAAVQTELGCMSLCVQAAGLFTAIKSYELDTIEYVPMVANHIMDTGCALASK